MDRRFWPDPRTMPWGHKVQTDIDRYGWHVTAIATDTMPPTYAYTTGLWCRYQHAELTVFGIAPQQLVSALNALGREIAAGSLSLDHGAEIGSFWEDGRLPARFRFARPHWEARLCAISRWLHRDQPVPLLQCFWPDGDGRFPWEPGFDRALLAYQPLLQEVGQKRARMERWMRHQERLLDGLLGGEPPVV